LLSGFLFCASFHAQAASLGLDKALQQVNHGSQPQNYRKAALLGSAKALQQLPDLASGNLTVEYNAANGLFTVSGDTSVYTAPDATAYSVLTDDQFGLGTFNLSANIATNGDLLGGTVTIVGGVFDDSGTEIYPWGTLLQGNLTAFGFEAATSTNKSEFDLLFNVTGGSLASVYGSVAGVLLHTEDDSFGGSFTSGFSNRGHGAADTRMMLIPEPEPQLLVFLSVLGLCWVARWRAPLRKG
jgi:hypothetical protein